MKEYKVPAGNGIGKGIHFPVGQHRHPVLCGKAQAAGQIVQRISDGAGGNGGSLNLALSSNGKMFV
jgi:hypothetical protein